MTWIEQLATKKNSIGASSTIAVSKTGFSAGAHQIARAYGITLKDVHTLDKAALNTLLALNLVQFTHKRVAFVSIGLRFAKTEPWTAPSAVEIDLHLSCRYRSFRAYLSQYGGRSPLVNQ